MSDGNLLSETFSFEFKQEIELNIEDELDEVDEEIEPFELKKTTKREARAVGRALRQQAPEQRDLALKRKDAERKRLSRLRETQEQADERRRKQRERRAKARVAEAT